MLTTRRFVLTSSGSLAVAFSLGELSIIQSASAQNRSGATQDASDDWREQYAYTLGIQAYIFGFPYVYLPSLRWNWVTQPKPAGSTTPYAPLNHFYNSRKLFDASYRDGGAPNNDTLYSWGFMDVSKEPLILSHPNMGERYFVFELASMDSDNFAYVGKRTTGGAAGSFAIVGPDWKGDLPAGVRPLTPSRTPYVLIFGRTLVDGPSDIPAVTALQDQYSLVPLSLWGKTNVRLPESRDVWEPFDAKSDPLAEWKTMNRAMIENPPEPRLAKLLGLFGKIGVGGPYQDIDKLDDATKRGLARAAVDGRKMLNEVIRSGQLGKRVNGWNQPPKEFGRAGLSDNFLLRASVQCLGGIIANDPEEAVYFNTALDGSGRPLDGSKRYTLRFEPGQLPKVEGFWSITLYDETYNLTPNPINRYAIRDRTAGLKKDADGGLTIYLQNSSPGQDKETNWLPTTQSGLFLLAFRTYIPGKDILDQTYALPPIMPVA
jgi:hypothetical protein